MGTLLGPEESGRAHPIEFESLRVVWLGGVLWCPGFFVRAGLLEIASRLLAWIRVWVGVWSLFENCIVDASIFIFVVKLVRAHGGCLGTRSR